MSESQKRVDPYCDFCNRTMSTQEYSLTCSMCGDVVHAKSCGRICANITEQDDEKLQSTRCNKGFCLKHAMRSRRCCLDHDSLDFLVGEDDDADDNKTNPYLADVLCKEHSNTCKTCGIVVCDYHNELAYSQIDAKIYHCSNCCKSVCDLHAVICEECWDSECLECAGLPKGSEHADWSKEYDGDYTCKRHRYRQHIEAELTPPDSPAGEPMSEQTRKRLKRDK